MRGQTNASNIRNTVTKLNITGTAQAGASVLKTHTVTEAGSYLITAVIETGGVSAGGYVLGIGNSSSDGWGQSTYSMNNGDNVRLSMSRVLDLNAGDTVYVNFYNGAGSSITLNGREMSIVRLN